MTTLRVLLLGDTHLGFDGEPGHPRVERPRRAADFLANYERALLPAYRGEVDLVVHGGDVFYRSRIPASLVERAFRPLAQIGAQGTPVFVVPGNHERSQIPFPLLALHKNVFIFDRPRTFDAQIKGLSVALSGFPYATDVRARFTGLVAQTQHAPRDVNLLCIHHAVEGARVGTPEFVFTSGSDVIRARDLPRQFCAVLSGHIHRGQRLSTKVPVYYAGSVERTSFAERHETKGYLILQVTPGGVQRHEWHALPARPMHIVDSLEALDRLPRDAIVRVDVEGLTAADLRARAPPSMIVLPKIEKRINMPAT